MGNGFSYFMLAIWPITVLYCYSTRPVQKATLWSILGGFMFLPVKTNIDLPLIPPLDKYSIPVLSSLICCRYIAKKRIVYFDNTGGFSLLVIMIFLTPYITVLNNKEVVFVGGGILNGLTNHDALSMIIDRFLLIAPFFIGRNFFRRYEDQVLLFKALIVGGLIYTLFILVEVRMSPQFHNWVYGYFPHSFAQQKRFGGFRPVVFIGHGLEVAFFMALVLISSVGLWTTRNLVSKLKSQYLIIYILFILFICKSVASFIYGVFGWLVVFMMSIKRVIYVALMLASLAIGYPFMSITNVFPHQAIVELANEYYEERASSLEFRFDNEAALLEHANHKAFFGWGGWGRNLIYNEFGRNTSIIDGNWILIFGQFGWVGFLTIFGLMYITVVKSVKALKYLNEKDQKQMLSVHALIVSIIMIDQLPNSSLVSFYWLIIGALYGRAEQIILDFRFKKNLTNKS